MDEHDGGADNDDEPQDCGEEKTLFAPHGLTVF
jgi:hypothetical protein